MNFYEKTGIRKFCGEIWQKMEECALDADKMAAYSSVK